MPTKLCATWQAQGGGAMTFLVRHLWMYPLHADSERPESRVIDRVVVKGKSVPLELIELRHPNSPQNFSDIAKIYSEAFVFYQNGNFSEAERLFRSLSDSDKPSTVLAERCAEFALHPPQDWRGTFTLTTKSRA